MGFLRPAGHRLPVVLVALAAGRAATAPCPLAAAAPCPLAATAATATRLHVLLQAPSADGCLLEDIEAEPTRVVVHWRGPVAPVLEAVLVSTACGAQADAIGPELSLADADALRLECPDAWARVYAAVRGTGFGLLDLRTLSTTAAHGPGGAEPNDNDAWDEVTAAPRGLVFFSALALGALALLLARRRQAATWVGAVLVLSAASLCTELCVLLPRFAAGRQFQSVDLSLLAGASWPPHLDDLMRFRPSALVEIAALRQLVPLRASAWVWAAFALHALNSAMVFQLARRLRLEQRWAAAVALAFLASPALIETFAVRFLLESALVGCYLLLAYAYLRQGEATSRNARLGWSAVALASIGLGLGYKESMLIYPLLLGGLELACHPVTGAIAASDWRARLHRLGLPLMAWPLFGALGLSAIRQSVAQRALSFAPANLIAQLHGALSAAVGLPLEWAPAGALLLPLAVVAAVSRHAAAATRAGLALLLVALLPVLPLSQRLAPGYAYGLAAGLALILGGIMAEARSHLLRGACLTAVMAAMLARPTLTSSNVGLPSSALAAAQSDAAGQACATSSGLWRLDSDTWRLIYRAYVARTQPSASHGALQRECRDERAEPDLQAAWRCLYDDWTHRAASGSTESPVGQLHQLLWTRCNERTGRVIYDGEGATRGTAPSPTSAPP